jgi:hypothetical protein
MMLWMANIEPGTSDEALRAFVRKYARDVECVLVKRIDGNGTRPAALLSFVGGTWDSVPRLALRLNGMYWQGRPLSCGAERGLP